MALTPGTRLGVYEVTAQIGVGGMGEVYRATDTSLKRQVAVKVLPAAVAADADRLARFQREAEVLAALNHPNIAAIYGLEKSEGITALVMELVEGDDLSQLIARHATPEAESLRSRPRDTEGSVMASGGGAPREQGSRLTPPADYPFPTRSPSRARSRKPSRPRRPSRRSTARCEESVTTPMS